MYVTLAIPITAVCIKESNDQIYCLKHDLKVGESYEVTNINIGQSHTSVLLATKDGIYNSVYLEFYCKERKIDIYKSPLFNGYIKLPIDKLLHFIDEEKKGDNNL